MINAPLFEFLGIFDDFIDKPVRATRLYACLAEHLKIDFVYDEAGDRVVYLSLSRLLRRHDQPFRVADAVEGV